MPIIALFSLTSLFSALPLFSAQPFIAKAILPIYGGSPAVWNTAMVFFQGCLLAGYALAHLGLRHLSWKRLGLINLSLALLTAGWLLPPPADTGAACCRPSSGAVPAAPAGHQHGAAIPVGLLQCPIAAVLVFAKRPPATRQSLLPLRSQ